MVQAAHMKPLRITIIGMGPRGLSLFERIAAHARAVPAPVQLNLVEPGECGPGVHAPQQPQHLLINTLACQVTAFPSPGTVALPCACAAPSLTEWARAQGYRRFGEQFLVAEGGAPIGEADYLPRQLLGRYLAWAYGQLARSLPPSVALRHWRQRACDLAPQPDGSYLVALADGSAVPSDAVLLATGHGRNRPCAQQELFRHFVRGHGRRNARLAYFEQAYPLAALAAIGADAVVGIEGMGLTAHDVLAELTAGRGGRFDACAGALRYVPSGREPRLLLYSRHCLPAAARGINQKGLAGRQQARFFTRDTVQALRQAGGPQLDFEAALLPLMIKEMAYAWRSARDGAAPDPARFTPGAGEVAAVEALLFPLRGKSFGNAQDFAAFVDAYLDEDLREAEQGNLGSPAKAAADVLRDARAVLQEMVEHGGLAPDAHRLFLARYHPAINRLTFGPPRHRNAQLRALRAAGIVTLGAGPWPQLATDAARAQFALHTRFAAASAIQHFDVLVQARLDAFSPETDDSPLCANLMRRGLVRPYMNGAFHPSGIDIDRAGHPVGCDGRVQMRLWALGYPAEGAHYYTHALPRPGLPSRAVLDADRCVQELFTLAPAPDVSGQIHSVTSIKSGIL